MHIFDSFACFVSRAWRVFRLASRTSVKRALRQGHPIYLAPLLVPLHLASRWPHSTLLKYLMLEKACRMDFHASMVYPLLSNAHLMR